MRGYPAREGMTVERATDVYRTRHWHKAVVQYRAEEGEDTTEAAVYLWHRDDDGWTRQERYVVETPAAWAADRAVIDELCDSLDDAPPEPGLDDLPVEDDHSVRRARTVFRTDRRWKAVVHLDRVGDCETDEVVVYLWHRGDDGWHRRQKYVVRDPGEWRRERDLVTAFVGDGGRESATSGRDDAEPSTRGSPEGTGRAEGPARSVEGTGSS
jgi:hypothetical protein